MRDAETVALTVCSSRNGPIVDAILPPPGDRTGPVALKWLGAAHGGWRTSLLALARAGTVDGVRPCRPRTTAGWAATR